MSCARVGSGTCASSAWRTIGASTPSMSRRMPARAGSARRGAIASESVAAADTGLVCPYGAAPDARTRGGRLRGRAVQRAVRRGRRRRRRAAPRAALRLSRPRRHGHLAARDRRHGGGGDARAGCLRQPPRRRRPARRRARRRGGRRRHVAAAARAGPDRPAAVRRGPRRRGRRPRAAVIAAILVGALAGVLAGLLGVGGGVLFVPALTVFLGLGQVDAEATSLLAIMPMALVGAWRQHGYGNVRLRDGAVLGALAVPGAVAGVSIVEALPERAVQVSFAGLMLLIAWRMVRGAPRQEPEAQAASPAAGPD